MKTKNQFTLLLPFLGMVVGLWLSPNLANSQSLEEYLQQATTTNPGLKASYERYQAASERVNQVSLPDPEFQVGVFLRPMDRFMGRQTADTRLMQEFPWFGMLRTQKEEAYQMAQVAYFEYLEEKNQLLLQLRSSWQELMLLQGQNQLAQANLEYLKKYEELALLQYSAGSSPTSTPTAFLNPTSTQATASSTGGSQMSQMGGSNSTSSSPTSMSASMQRTTMNAGISGMSTVLQIRLQVKELEARIQQLQSNSELLRIQFNQVLGRPMTAAIQLPEIWEQPTLLLEKQEYLDKILQNHPMLSMYASENLALAQQGKMAKLEGKPMLGAGVNYMTFTPRIENGMPMGGDNMVMPMVSLSLPIYRKKIAAKIKEVELLQGATTLKQQETQNDLSLSWAAAFRDWEDSKRQITLFSEQVALVQQQIQLLETSFTTGSFSLQELLQTQQLLLEYQEKQLLAQYQGHQSLARLEALFSTTPLN
jgi:outer membrane protein TolC